MIEYPASSWVRWLNFEKLETLGDLEDLTGIKLAYKLQHHLNDFVEFQILEKNPDLGGTWYENKYPGSFKLF